MAETMHYALVPAAFTPSASSLQSRHLSAGQGAGSSLRAHARLRTAIRHGSEDTSPQRAASDPRRE